jgi:S-adenosylmethionine/arginine decarboxylase-like enzyme
MIITAIPPACSTCTFVGAAEESARRDAAIRAEFKELDPWGLAIAIDLGSCDPQHIRDPAHIERFVMALCDLITMRRYGDPIIVRFGADPRVSGYSLVQLIETSLISGHFAEESNAAYIDIFSCKPYPPYQTAVFCCDWFGAITARVQVTLRCAEGPLPSYESEGYKINTAGDIPVLEQFPIGGDDAVDLITGLRLTYTPAAALRIGMPTIFTAAVTSGTGVTYTWDFGDGSSDGGGNPVAHSYAAPGTYTVVVTATNAASSVTTSARLCVAEALPKLYRPQSKQSNL